MARWRNPALVAMLGLACAALPAHAGERETKLTALVREDCGSCHGMTLKGGLGAPLLPQDLEGKDAGSLAAIILDGVPNKPMPPWRGLLSEADALWIAQRLKEGFPQ